MLKKLGGVRTPHKKGTANSREKLMTISPFVTIPMSMHRGKPANCIVKTGDVLKVGQRIGEADGKDSAHVHSSVSGTVKEITETDPVTGRAQTSVVVATDGLQTYD
jgi:electron transport complex protein RnfC